MNRRAFSVAAIAVTLAAGCQNAPTSAPPEARVSVQTVKQETDAIFEKLVAIRRDIHEHPELAGNEVRTATKIATHLRGLGLEVRTGLYGQSVIGVLRGARPGKTVAWRADLDALPGFYPDPEPFRSKTPNVHHACGHDIHIAIALGMAEVLAKQRASLSGNVVFIFQPEEETFKGAQGLIERGLLTQMKLDEIYGVHVTAFSAGEIRVRPGEMFAYQRRVRIALKNELSKAQVEALTKQVQGAMFRARPDAKPWEIQRLVDPAVGVGVPSTSFQDFLFMDSNFDSQVENGELRLSAYLYETNAANLPTLIPRIEAAVAASGHKAQLLGVSFVQANPTVMNDPELTRAAVTALERASAPNTVLPLYGQAPFFNDDFAYFQQRVPGVYFFLGGSNFQKGMIAFNHAPNFHADEETIRSGVQSFSALLLSRLGVVVQK